MGECENVDINMIYNELRYIHKKMDQLEKLLIPMEKMTEDDKKDLDEALKDYKAGKTVNFKDIRKD